jgi:hypothetical protein
MPGKIDEALAQLVRIQQQVAANKLSNADLVKQLDALATTLQATQSHVSGKLRSAIRMRDGRANPTRYRKEASPAPPGKTLNYSLPLSKQAASPEDCSRHSESDSDEDQDVSFQRLSAMLERSITSAQDALSTPGASTSLLREESQEYAFPSSEPLRNSPIDLRRDTPSAAFMTTGYHTDEHDLPMAAPLAKDTLATTPAPAPPSYEEHFSESLIHDDGMARLNQLIDTIAVATRQLQPAGSGMTPSSIFAAFAVLLLAILAARSGHFNCHCLCPLPSD